MYLLVSMPSKVMFDEVFFRMNVMSRVLTLLALFILARDGVKKAGKVIYGGLK